MAHIPRLSSGGIIANYRCPASCGHCMYGCSPTSEAGYIDDSTAKKVCARLYSLGCRSVHIGGGEPFLNPGGLVKLIENIKDSGLRLDYIETNAAWITSDDDRNRKILSSVVRAGGGCIMVSADPFHVEFVPFWKTERLIRLFSEMNISNFVWQEKYLPVLRKLDPERTYKTEELSSIFGYDVAERCAREYGMGFNGRALNLLRKYGKKYPVSSLLGSCPELYNTNHFHADYLNRYIPSGCTGMGILLEDVDSALDEKKYPVMARLLVGGVGALFEYAQKEGFIPAPEGYGSKCDLCFNIRKFFIKIDRAAYPDLTPESYYNQNF